MRTTYPAATERIYLSSETIRYDHPRRKDKNHRFGDDRLSSRRPRRRTRLQPALSLANTVVGAPLRGSQVALVLAVVAFGAAYPYVAGNWSIGRLVGFAVAFLVSMAAFRVVGTLGLSAVGVPVQNPISRIAALILAYVTAYLVVYRRGSIR
ncbi:hypothetical protein ACNS7O_02745 [Haloferacaceae archaeon DSL9]